MFSPRHIAAQDANRYFGTGWENSVYRNKPENKGVQEMRDYQETGAVKIADYPRGMLALKKANEEINLARKKTPISEREFYRSSIRFQNGSYIWGWIQK